MPDCFTKFKDLRKDNFKSKPEREINVKSVHNVEINKLQEEINEHLKKTSEALVRRVRDWFR